MSRLRKTRFYTYSYKTYHRTKFCSYLIKLNQKKINSFLQYEPPTIGGPITTRVNRVHFEMNSCPRCGI
jgi:hypothetical protein